MMHSLIALVTLLSLALFFWMGADVARARGRFGVPAPAVTGHPEFERHFRVQANTLEGLVLFLPSLWVFALTIDALRGSDLGDKIAAAPRIGVDRRTRDIHAILCARSGQSRSGFWRSGAGDRAAADRRHRCDCLGPHQDG